MAFPPGFLDELRARVSLADLVARRVKLTKRGREYIGLCPFHKEKTPSFNVVEDKGFYHCFGCGAHGDVIGFAMQTGNMSFPEAVEALAQQAGLEVPKATAEARERARRDATLQGALDAACAFFEGALAAPGGREARLYLERRGLDEATIRRFRLGYAPDARDALKHTLGREFPEPLLIEAGLLRQPAERGESYDYFRNRVIFPIGDRAGRPIAFGGRVLGDGQPKYLNSPDTPLFEKGRVLYGWAQARGALLNKRSGAGEPSAIVTEGYMDVIALHRAGFETAVAPLGTALTEPQIDALWRLAPEPVLCFDGDAAGTRAAGRALERALPLLRPGFSLRFATLPAGEDPDTLILRQGAAAMREVLDQALPLAEVLWSLETARPVDTPERRADLERRLEERVRLIADRSVQEHYRRFFRERLFGFLRARGLSPARGRGGRSRWFGGRGEPPPAHPFEGRPLQPDPRHLARHRPEVVVALLLNHPFLLNEVAEELAELELGGDLDKLCREILQAHALHPDLDADGLMLHLSRTGFADMVKRVLGAEVLMHARFARADADAALVRTGWVDIRGQFQKRMLKTQIAEAERSLAEDITDEAWQPLLQFHLDQKSEDDGATGGGSADGLLP